MVERTAHNGLDVGSIPTKPKNKKMEFTNPIYKTNKVRLYIKKNCIFFLFNGSTIKSCDWIPTEQNLKSMNFKHYKVLNKTTIKTFNKSIYQLTKTTINGTTFFIKPNLNVKSITKQLILKVFDPLLFSLIAIKINNKIYSSKQVKDVLSLNYKTNKLFLYQFRITNLKLYF